MVGSAHPSAPVSVFGPRGGSPLQARTLRPVTERNCVAARRGGEQRDVNDQSATQVNSIRPCRAASLLGNGEARTGAIRKSVTLRGSVQKRSRGRLGGWRRNGLDGQTHDTGRPARVQAEFIVPDKDTKSRRAGVRAPIVASKPGNSGGAKGCREVESIGPEPWKRPPANARPPRAAWLALTERPRWQHRES